MDRVKVTSRQLAAVGYNEEKRILEVEFHPKGSVYQYRNVSPEIHAELMAAESKGKYFNAEIKKFPDRFPFTKMDPAAAAAGQ